MSESRRSIVKAYRVSYTSIVKFATNVFTLIESMRQCVSIDDFWMQSWRFISNLLLIVTVCQNEPACRIMRFISARCTLVQSAVLPSHAVCLSVRPSVTLVNCDHIGWNSSKIISRLVSLGCSLFATPTWQVYYKGFPTSGGVKQGKGG